MKIRGALVGLGVVSMVVGGIVGPGYYWYCTQLSGERVGKYSLWRSGKAPPAWVEMKGAPPPYSPVALELHPGMNPVGFIWAGTSSVVSTFDRPSNHYRAVLYLDSHKLMVEDFSVSFNDKESGGLRITWIPIGAIDVPRAGTYRFVLEDSTHPRLSFSDMHIEVRRNVVRPNIAVALGGGALALAGLFLAIAMLYLGRKADQAAAQQAVPEAFYSRPNSLDFPYKVFLVFLSVFMAAVAGILLYSTF